MQDEAAEALEIASLKFLILEDGTELPLWVQPGRGVPKPGPQEGRPGVVVLFPYPLFPADNGGSVRTLVLLRALRNAGYFVWLVGVGLRSEHRAELTLCADAVVALPDFPTDPETRIRESGLNSLRARYHPAFDEVVPALVEFSSPRAVVACFAFSAYALSRVPDGLLRIVDTIDIQHRRADVAREHGGDLESRRCSRDDELEAIGHADVLISIQPAERTVFESMFPDKFHVVCGHAVDECRSLAPDRHSRKVLFVGNRYDPNTRGIRAFIRDVWPAVLEHVPDATLDVVGTVCRDLSDDAPRVRLHGFVPDVEPFYERAAVVVNPVAYGSGQKIKTIEALAFGKCLVMTPAARQGISQDAPCVEREMHSMADAVIDMLENPEKRVELERDALEFAKLNFVPEEIFRDLFTVLEGGGATAWRP